MDYTVQGRNKTTVRDFWNLLNNVHGRVCLTIWVQICVQLMKSYGSYINLDHFSRAPPTSLVPLLCDIRLEHQIEAPIIIPCLSRHLLMSGTWMEFVQTQEDSYGTAAQQFPPLASRGGARNHSCWTEWVEVSNMTRNSATWWLFKKDFSFKFLPLLWKISNWTTIFQMGLNHQTYEVRFDWN